MRFDTVIRNGAVSTSARGLVSSLLFTMLAFLSIPSLAQKTSDTSEPPEMLVTEEGFLAINTPKGWVRADGPGLAYFVLESERERQPSAWIYISSAPVGPKEESKDMKAYIESDIAEFKKRFKGGVVQEETPLELPFAKIQAPIYTFESGEKRNTVEQVAYVSEINRVLTLVLSAKERAPFEKALPAFRDFARSYRGSITPASKSN